MARPAGPCRRGPVVRMLIRADGSAEIGLGHISRTTALAEEARARGWEVSYATVADPVAVGLLQRRGQRLSALASASDRGWAATLDRGDVVVLDGYHLGEHDVRAAQRRGATVLALH